MLAVLVGIPIDRVIRNSPRMPQKFKSVFPLPGAPWPTTDFPRFLASIRKLNSLRVALENEKGTVAQAPPAVLCRR